MIGDDFLHAHTALADAKALSRVCAHQDMEIGHICSSKGPHYVEVGDYINEFIQKRQAIDSVTKKTVKSKIFTLMDMNKKRKTASEDPVSSLKKFCVRAL